MKYYFFSAEYLGSFKIQKKISGTIQAKNYTFVDCVYKQLIHSLERHGENPVVNSFNIVDTDTENRGNGAIVVSITGSYERKNIQQQVNNGIQVINTAH